MQIAGCEGSSAKESGAGMDMQRAREQFRAREFPRSQSNGFPTHASPHPQWVLFLHLESNHLPGLLIIAVYYLTFFE